MAGWMGREIFAELRKLISLPMSFWVCDNAEATECYTTGALDLRRTIGRWLEDFSGHGLPHHPQPDGEPHGYQHRDQQHKA